MFEPRREYTNAGLDELDLEASSLKYFKKVRKSVIAWVP